MLVTVKNPLDDSDVEVELSIGVTFSINQEGVKILLVSASGVKEL
jgi:hypothetical protein